MSAGVFALLISHSVSISQFCFTSEITDFICSLFIPRTDFMSTFPWQNFDGYPVLAPINSPTNWILSKLGSTYSVAFSTIGAKTCPSFIEGRGLALCLSGILLCADFLPSMGPALNSGVK